MVAAGDRDQAQRLIRASLGGTAAILGEPTDIDHPTLDALLNLVIDPAPVDAGDSAAVFHQALHQMGYLQRADQYGSRAYQRNGNAIHAELLTEEARLLNQQR